MGLMVSPGAYQRLYSAISKAKANTCKAQSPHSQGKSGRRQEEEMTAKAREL